MADDLGIHPRQVVVDVVLLLILVALHEVLERALCRVHGYNIPADPCTAAAFALVVRSLERCNPTMPSNLWSTC